MSKKYTSSSWTDDWMKAQRDYLDAMSALAYSPTRMANNGKVDNPMSDAMDFWWKNVSPRISEENREFIDKLAEQGRIFYALSEHFINLLKGINTISESSENWEEALTRQFDELKNFFITTDNGQKAMHGMLSAWNLLPMDTLQRTFSSGSIMPGDILEDLKPETLEEVTDKFLSIPGVGYSRELQEQVQIGIKLGNNYQKTLREYTNSMHRVSIRALDRMRDKIIAMAADGKEFNSMREIYDLWVDCNEEAYADYVFTDEFSELYGKLTNSLMEVKQHGRNMVDEVLGGMNMPTRRGMNSVHKRQQELRREYKEVLKKMAGLEEKIEIFEKNKIKAEPPQPVAKKSGAEKGKKASGGNKKPTRKKVSKSSARKKTSRNTDKIVIKL